MEISLHTKNQIPSIEQIKVYTVAGEDSMLLNLSGAHAPYFTRNVVIIKDSHGNIGAGEVPGEKRLKKRLKRRLFF